MAHGTPASGRSLGFFTPDPHPMKHLAVLCTVVALALTGCTGMIKTSGSGVGLGGGSSPGAATSPEATSSGWPERATAPPPEDNPFLERAQLQTLLGKSPDEARQLLATYGHHGKVAIEADDEVHPSCADDRICAYSGPYAGVAKDADITLYTNP